MSKDSKTGATVAPHTPGGTLGAPRPSEWASGQLIVRFKEKAIKEVAANPVPMLATARVAAAAMPETIAGPLSLLREQTGMLSVKPLFVQARKTKTPQPRMMAFAAVHNMLALSATEPTRPELSGFELIRVQDKVSPALLKRINASPAVDFVEPVPNRWLCSGDPVVNRQWGLRAIRWFDAKRPDAAKVHVAVLDSGIDDGHPDLKDVVDLYSHDGNSARDFLGHGTHVSGIVAATIDNAAGIAGVANCRLHCWKIYDDPPAGSREQKFNFEYYSAALAAALDSEVRVINLSIAGTANSATEAAVFQELSDAGVVVVAAMGNEYLEGNPTEFPAAYPTVLAVGAVDEADRRAPFSCTGKHIGLVAPGVNILSTVPHQLAAFAKATDYDSWPGTSMAAPHVAGAAALLYAKQTKSKPAAAAIVKTLTDNAKKLPGMNKAAFTNEYGAGLLDLAAVLH
ncbi:MAG TPA: S8 family serine peptidase [Steroidobacteraceae bacterium]|nr:S8 family serine peptidase [Steroidobacteraceae bacterium]